MTQIVKEKETKNETNNNPYPQSIVITKVQETSVLSSIQNNSLICVLQMTYYSFPKLMLDH